MISAESLPTVFPMVPRVECEGEGRVRGGRTPTMYAGEGVTRFMRSGGGVVLDTHPMGIISRSVEGGLIAHRHPRHPV